MRIIAIVILLILLSLPATAQELPKSQIRPESFEEQNLPSDVKKQLTFYDSHRGIIKSVKIDLNGDNVGDYISIGENCGTGGCGYQILDGKTHRVIGDEDALFGNPIFIFDQMINRHSVLTTYSHASAGSGSYTTYVFDGKKYQSISCVFLIGEAVEELFKRYEKVPQVSPNQFQLENGKEFSRKIKEGLLFRLVPQEDGWIVQIQPSIYPKDQYPLGPPNFAAVTPPFHGLNATDIQSWHFHKIDNAPGRIRQIQYCSSIKEYQVWEKEYEDWHSGSCSSSAQGCFPSKGCQNSFTLIIDDMEFRNGLKDQKSSIQNIRFTLKDIGGKG